MGSAAHELDELRDATDLAVSRVLSDLVLASASSPSPGLRSVQLVVVGPGQAGEFRAAGPVSFASFGRDVVVPALVQGQPADPELPTTITLARYLASRDILTDPEHAELWASARWLTTSGGQAEALGKRLCADRIRVGLILVADGAACHGPKAPRAQDARATPYDAEVRAALASGRPGRLAALDANLGDELGATGSQVWPLLAAAAGADHADAVGEVLWSGAPYGVGWTVASWRRPCQ
jgi:hypothetical protein